MPYDFSRFSPQSFERLVQAISLAKFGANTQIYGVGKDGAREATFEGSADQENGQWDGYVVVQAKYQENVLTPRENVRWLKRQLDLELKKFQSRSRNLRRPDYYIIASNTRLSASAADINGRGRGGIDEISDYLERWKTKIGIKGFAIWHQDALTALLDGLPSIRQTFNSWVLPGDVLSSCLLALQEVSVESCLPTYLRDQLTRNLDIKTKDAGQTTGRKVVLDQIFIDLPVNMTSVHIYSDGNAISDFLLVDEDEQEAWQPRIDLFEPGAPDFEEIDYDAFDEDGSEDQLFISAVLDRCSDCLAPKAIQIEDPHRRAMNRLVLLGGPGQGKSTLSQFLAQIMRARLLEKHACNSPEVEEAIGSVLARARAEGIRLSGPLRFPFAIDLPSYADALSQAQSDGRDLTLLSYVVDQVASGESGLTVPSFKKFLQSSPSAFILDGLDEIPHSGNRGEVLAHVQRLVDTCYELDADMFFLVTSRPQGYQHELDVRYWSHWELESLRREQALRFAAQLSSVLVADTARRAEISETLALAAKAEATTQLLKSPLQVSLLFALVETRNNIPNDRWTLFFRYYEILRDREIAKGGANGALIGNYRTIIDRLHYEAGYLLHVRAENTGHANAHFSPSELTQVLLGLLVSSGYEDDLEELAGRITELATTRLVFLRARTEGQIAFDVRSLQEFMAAARIMASPELKIRDRLREIAGLSHWLHVFEIACSKVYSSADLESMGPEIFAILDALDKGDRNESDFAIKSGSALAMQLLADGVAGSMPSARRGLYARALGCLETADPMAPYKLAAVTDSSHLRVLESALPPVLNAGPSRSAYSALRLLLLLEQSHCSECASWASEFLAGRLPSFEGDALNIVNRRSLVPRGGRSFDWLATILRTVGYPRTRAWVSSLGGDKAQTEQLYEKDLYPYRVGPVDICRLVTRGGRPTLVGFSFFRIVNHVKVAQPEADSPADWKILSLTQEFCESPSQDSLSRFVRNIASQNLRPSGMLDLPWIILSVLKLLTDGVSAQELIAEIDGGTWGRRQDWIQSEEAWCLAGASLDDISFDRPRPGKLPGNLLPVSVAPSISNEALSLLELKEYTSSFLDDAGPQVRETATFARVLGFICRVQRGMPLSESTLDRLLEHVAVASDDLARFRGVLSLLYLPTSLFERKSVQDGLKQVCLGFEAVPQLSASLFERVLYMAGKGEENRFYLVLLAGCLSNTRAKADNLCFVPDEMLVPRQSDGSAMRQALSLLRFMRYNEKPDMADFREFSFKYVKSALAAGSTPFELDMQVITALALDKFTLPKSDSDSESSFKFLIENAARQTSGLVREKVCRDLLLPAPI